MTFYRALLDYVDNIIIIILINSDKTIVPLLKIKRVSSANQSRERDVKGYGKH